MVAKVRDGTVIPRGRVSIRGGFRQKFQELAAHEDLEGAAASRGQTSRWLGLEHPRRDSDAFIMTENCLIFSRSR